MKSRKPECLLFRVARYGGDGVLLPADGYTSKRLRERRYQVGEATVRRMCEHIAREYWPSVSAEQIEAMAQVMPEAT